MRGGVRGCLDDAAALTAALVSAFERWLQPEGKGEQPVTAVAEERQVLAGVAQELRREPVKRAA